MDNRKMVMDLTDCCALHVQYRVCSSGSYTLCATVKTSHTPYSQQQVWERMCKSV